MTSLLQLTRVLQWKPKFSSEKSLDSLRKPAITAVLLSLLLFYIPNCAFAKSGGRVGGSAWSQTSSSSSNSEPSCSHSSPSSSSSYSSVTYYEPSYSYSAPLRFKRVSYSAPSRFKRVSYSAPSWRFKSSAPSRSYSDQQLQKSDAIIILFVCILCSLILVYVFRSRSKCSQDDEKTSVLKLQIGMLGSGRTLQRDFDRLAENADTSTLKGLSYVLNEATLALLRHPDYCISCYSSVDVKCKEEEGEKLFNQLSIEERRKLDEETLVNVDSIKRQSSKFRTASGFASEYIVVTILVAAKGIQKLQPINRIRELKEALQKLGSIPRNRIMAVEILWTPQEENEVLSERELVEDYPHLRPIYDCYFS